MTRWVVVGGYRTQTTRTRAHDQGGRTHVHTSTHRTLHIRTPRTQARAPPLHTRTQTASHLADALEGHPYIKDLNLRNNDFRDVGALKIVKASTTCSAMVNVDLQFNKFSASCDMAIINALYAARRCRSCPQSSAPNTRACSLHPHK